MFANGFEKINFSIKSEIVSFAKSFCGKYLAVLFRNSIHIYSLINNSFPKLDEYTRDESSIQSKNFNHWIQWISLDTIVIGTQTGHLIFIRINNKEAVNENSSNIIESVNSIDITDKIITAHSSAFGALVITTPGPIIHFISPSGEILSSLSFTVAQSDYSSQIPGIIRQIDINSPISLFVFSDGKVAHSKLKEQSIIDKKPILIEFFPMINDVSKAFFSSNKNFIVFLTFNGVLMRMFTSTNEITVICDECSIFHITHDSFHIISLSPKGMLSIWSNRTDHLSKTQLKIDSQNSNQTSELISNSSFTLDFVASEIDIYGYRLFCATSHSQEAFSISFAITNMSKPSLMFCTPTYVIIPPTKVTISSPIDMFESGYPLKYVAYLPEKKNTAVAGRKYFSLFTNDSKSWKIVKDENNFCRALWSIYSNCFISVVFNFEESRYHLFLLSSDFLSLIDSIKLDGNFIDYDNYGNCFAVGTSTSVTTYKVVYFNQMSLKITKLHKYENLPYYEKVILFHNSRTVLILTLDKQLIELTSNEVLIEGVTSVIICKENDLIFIVAHGHQFAYYYPEKSLIRLDIKTPGIIVDGLSLYIIPDYYEFGKFELETYEYLPQVIFHFIDQPNVMFDIVKAFSATNNYSISVSHTMNLAFKAGKFESFNAMLDKLGDAKITFLFISLFNVDSEFVPKIKELLPSCDELIKKYPDLSEQIKGIYAK